MPKPNTSHCTTVPAAEAALKVTVNTLPGASKRLAVVVPEVLKGIITAPVAALRTTVANVATVMPSTMTVTVAEVVVALGLRTTTWVGITLAWPAFVRTVWAVVMVASSWTEAKTATVPGVKV